MVPMVVESSGRGERVFDIYSRLLRDRIVCLTGPIDEDTAGLVTAQLLFLEAEDPEKPVRLYIQSPGGDVYAGLGICDTIGLLRAPVSTVCTGLCASMASVILACGAPGQRFCLPHSTVMLHQPWVNGGGVRTASDLKIQAEETLRLRGLIHEVLATRTGRPVEEIARDTERDRWLDAGQAVAYGLVDGILGPGGRRAGDAAATPREGGSA
jgi:ATP-dependent Clp protease protease subunit